MEYSLHERGRTFTFLISYMSFVNCNRHAVKLVTVVILPVVLYGCETWSLTLKEELRLRVFENRVLKRVFGPKRDEVTGEWGKLHNEELNDLYSLPNIVRW